jgi:hypothetical protein
MGSDQLQAKGGRMDETDSLKLDWYELGQSGANFARHFGARASGGALVASVFEGPGKAGVGLAFVPTAATQALSWASVTSPGANFARHFRAGISGRTLVASFLEGAGAPPGGGKAGLGLALMPAAACQSLNWVPVNSHGANFAQHFAATVPGGTLVASVTEGVEKAGVGVAFVPTAVGSALSWESVSSQGANFARHFKAEIAGGSLIASMLEGTTKAGLGLAFAPTVTSGPLNWMFVGTQGANFASHYCARLSNGMLIASVLDGAKKAGVGLTRIPT